MPYKSDSQRRYFHAAEASGEISKKTVREFDQASKGKELPDKVNKHAHGGMIHRYATGGVVKNKSKSIHSALDQMKKEECLRKYWRGGKS